MRIRSLVATVGAATLLSGLMAAPASAGTGPSRWCTDPYSYLSLGPSSPITLAVEVSYEPNTSTNQVWLCYSTSATSTQSSIIGGAVGVGISTSTDLADLVATVTLSCKGDDYVSVGPLECGVVNGVGAVPSDVYAGPAGSVCLVALDGSCVYYLPFAPAVDTDARGDRPLLAVSIHGVGYHEVHLPPVCVGVLGGCD